jgi:REP element-mobilizing transposase RayT
MARPRRLPQFDYTGVQRYFLTICTLNRATHFVAADAVKLVVDQILLVAEQEAMAIPVYLLMPDHAHLLVDGEHDGSDLNMFIKLAKQHSGYEFKKKYRKHLWQDGYYEHVLRDAEKTEEVIEYIVSNPVRSKLAENPQDYPYWGSTVHTRKEILEFIGWASHRYKPPWRE